MPTIPLRIAGRTYKTQSRYQNGERTINFYPEIDESGDGVSEIVMYPTPGLRVLDDVRLQISETGASLGRVRGISIINNNTVATIPLSTSRNLIVVYGGFAKSYRSATSTFVLQNIYDDGLPVSMAANLNNQLVIASGSRGYITDGLSTSTSGPITDADFPDVKWVASLDQFIIALRDSFHQQFFISALNDASDWDPLDFATVEEGQDRQRVVMAVRSELWFIGEKLTVIYYNSGDLFPFIPRPGGVLHVGIEADFSIAEFDGHLFWLARTDEGGRFVIQANATDGYRIISDHAFQEQLMTYNVVSDARGFIQADRKHTFYWLYFPTENKTWVYDLATNMWHERAYFNLSSGIQEAHRAAAHAYFVGNWVTNTGAYQDLDTNGSDVDGRGRHIVGDRDLPVIYILDPEQYEDEFKETGAGATVSGPIVRERWTPILFKGSSGGSGRHTHNWLRIFCDVGVGLDGVTSGTPGFDPQLMLQWSDDGGGSWSNEILASLGKIGETQTVVEFRQLGSTHNHRMYRVKCSEPVPVRLLSAYLNVD